MFKIRPIALQTIKSGVIVPRPSINRVLENIVQASEMVLLMGNSGTGKSTSINFFTRNLMKNGTIPITCRIALRNATTRSSCIHALELGLGLREEDNAAVGTVSIFSD